MFESVLDPVFRPLLSLNSLVAIVIISFVISFLITIAYKFFTDQELMKELKGDLKNAQKEMKESSKDPAKMMQMQKEAMKKNLEYMKHSMKPTLITFLPIIIIFGWLNANFAYYPITPGTDFTTTVVFDRNIEGNAELIVPKDITIVDNKPAKEIQNNMATWTLNGKEGEYLLEYKLNDQTYTKELLITSEHRYKAPVERIREPGVKEIRIGNEPLKPLKIGNFKLGWIWTYIIFSIVFSMILRKIMKIH